MAGLVAAAIAFLIGHRGSAPAGALGIGEAKFLGGAAGAAGFEAADNLESAGPGRPPRDWSAATAVTLPDVWGYLRPEAGDEAWYRVRVDVGKLAAPPADAGNEPVWIYVEKIRSSAAAYVAGLSVWDGGKLRPPLQPALNEPVLFPVVQRLLADADGWIDFRVVAAGKEHGGLGRVYAGFRPAIQPMFATQRFWAVESVYITSAVITATALFILMLWMRTRETSGGYLALALAGFLWGLRNLNFVIVDAGGESAGWWWVWDTFVSSCSGWFIALLGWFLAVQFLSVASPRLARVVTQVSPVYLVLGPVLLLLPISRAEALAAWLLLGLPVLVLLVIGLVRYVIRFPSVMQGAFLGFFVVLVALNVYDNFTLRSSTRFGDLYLNHFAGVAFFVLSAQLLVERYGNLLRDHRALNLSLEQRLAERETQLDRQHQALVRAEAERAQLQERERIMRDLHDGLGSQLTAALHRSRSSGTTEIERIIEECLADLRLAIFSLEPASAYVSTVLGMLRGRLASAFEASGIRLIWEVSDLGRASSLDPTGILNLLRIVQEAISNALRHSAAASIRVRLNAIDSGFRIEIADDGHGFTIGAGPAGGGQGLRNMQRRARLIGATLAVESDAGGTVIRLDVPDPDLPAVTRSDDTRAPPAAA